MRIAACLVFIFLLPALVNAQAGEQATPLGVVNKRTKALADHDFDSFMSTYADNVEIFVYPDRPLSKGKERIRALFAPMFKNGDVEFEVAHQMVSDSFVVCESTISFADKSETTIAVYEVRDGLIQTVRFLRDGLRASQVKRNTDKTKPGARQ
ncbi:MAG: nuclear transport factor 2 family protein [Betaproteobacteria bacterium]